MISKDFIMDSVFFNRRVRSELQLKLRTVLKCYTITSFSLNETDKTFTFMKSYMINKKRLDDQKQCSGFYLIEYVGDDKVKIRITVN